YQAGQIERRNVEPEQRDQQPRPGPTNGEQRLIVHCGRLALEPQRISGARIAMIPTGSIEGSSRSRSPSTSNDAENGPAPIRRAFVASARFRIAPSGRPVIEMRSIGPCGKGISAAMASDMVMTSICAH